MLNLKPLIDLNDEVQFKNRFFNITMNILTQEYLILRQGHNSIIAIGDDDIGS